MQHLVRGLAAGLCARSIFPVALVAPVAAAPPAAPQAQAATLVIGVDQTDLANQNPTAKRWFEYTDFFTRNVTVHRGDSLDFRFAPGFHVIGLAPAGAAGRAAYPVALPDEEDVLPAAGSGTSKVVLGPGNDPVTGGTTQGGGTVGATFGRPFCGVVQMNQPSCSYTGGNQVDIAGGITGTD